MRKQGGFTLIELMIVVAIIGVLAAVAIPRYQDYVTKSKVAAAMATLKSFQTPAEAFYLENGTFPTSLSDIGGDTNLTDNGDGTGKIKAGNDALTYTFDSNAGPDAINGKTITLTRHSGDSATDTDGGATSGWECITTVTDDFAPKGCGSDTTTPNS